MRPFEYLRPESVEEAFGALDKFGSEARFLLGGTDLLVRLRSGHVRPRAVVDLKRAVGAGIAETPGGLRIGARTTMAAITADSGMQRYFPALVEAAGVVGSVQIRNRATLAGNICNASPAADTAPPLLVYGASVNIVSRSGGRVAALSEFWLGPGRTVLAPGELVESIDLSLPGGPAGSAFGRVTRRRGVDLATINLSCVVTAEGETRFAYGAAAPVPFLVRDKSGVLADPGASTATKDELLRALTAQARPITDVRGGRDYRQAMLLVMSRRALETALSRRLRGAG